MELKEINRSGLPTGTFIDPRASVAADVVLGENCLIASGAVLCKGTSLSFDISIDANVVFVEPSNGEAASQILQGVRIGANSTIYPGLVIAAHAIIRPGSVVTKSVPPGAIVDGYPATIIGYINSSKTKYSPHKNQGPSRLVEETLVRGVTLHQFPVIPDLRGNLTVGEFSKQIPFIPLRYFMVFGVPSKEIRGEHAHIACHQFLLCVRGSCSVVADDGNHRVEVNLDSPEKGIYLPPMTWGIQYRYSEDATLLVFASHHYDAKDYVRNYDEFLALVNAT